MADLVEFCRQHGIELTIVAYPSPFQIFANERDGRADARFWRAFCDREKVAFVDLFPVFIDPPAPRPGAVYERFFIPDDVHWNEAGNAHRGGSPGRAVPRAARAAGRESDGRAWIHDRFASTPNLTTRSRRRAVTAVRSAQRAARRAASTSATTGSSAASAAAPGRATRGARGAHDVLRPGRVLRQRRRRSGALGGSAGADAGADRAPSAPRVLDVGCGRGDFLALPRPRAGPHTRALWDRDWKPTAPLRRGAPIPAAEIVTGDAASALDGVAGAFDLVTLWDVFEHLVDPAAVLGALARRLPPDGAIFVQTIHEESAVPALGRALYFALAGSDSRPRTPNARGASPALLQSYGTGSSLPIAPGCGSGRSGSTASRWLAWTGAARSRLRRRRCSPSRTPSATASSSTCCWSGRSPSGSALAAAGSFPRRDAGRGPGSG